MVPEEEIAKIERMAELLHHWRLPGLFRVNPTHVIPDTTNREHTGLSPAHVHMIAMKMQDRGFCPRGRADGHDLPILVQESRASALGRESQEKWRQCVADSKGALPEHAMEDASFYTSLGNGHFFQALNLFQSRAPMLFEAGAHYSTEKDPLLHDAVFRGVECVVLRGDIPLLDRKFISLLLNAQFDYELVIDKHGAVAVGSAKMRTPASQFEAISKNCDSYELQELIETQRKLEAERKREAAQARSRL